MLNKDREILNGHSIKYKAYLNLMEGQVKPLSRFLFRIRKRGAGELQRFFRIGTGWSLSHSPGLMFKKALQENADLYVAHLECAFFTARNLIKAGKKVSYDFEDWYSRDYLVPERPVKLLEALEKFAFDNGKFITTASASMANALKKSYKSQREVTVIYNGFSKEESVPAQRSMLAETPNIKLLWFSRTVGAGRGIESILKTLPLCRKPVELHLLGDMSEGYRDFIEKEFAQLKPHRLVIHSFMPHRQLFKFIGQFAAGLAIEENINDNKILTVSNKILQYLQSGIKVIASDTQGHQEVATFFPNMVQVVDLADPLQMANAINNCYENRSFPIKNQQDLFNTIFSWEAQEKKLLQLLEK
jgi:glycosyltransferase involved in cell wall biosynthesis